MTLNTEALLAPITPELPCGDDLAYDPAYLELERKTKGTADTQFSEALEPDWKSVLRESQDLLGRTKDLRVSVYLALSALVIEGLPGFAAGLGVLRSILEEHWDDCHPRLDPEDDNDPLERMNILVALAPPAGGYEDPMRFRDRILDSPLCRSVQAGIFGLRHLLVRDGELSSSPTAKGADSASKPPDAALIDAAFMDTDVDLLIENGASLTSALEHVTAIDQLLTEKVGVGSAIDLAGIIKLLKQASKYIQGYLLQRGVGVEETVEETTPEDDGWGTPAAATTSRPSLGGEVNSIEDVFRAMDAINRYYSKYEPSSPVPLLIARARRLVGKNFIELLTDLSPDAVAAVEVLSGGADISSTGSAAGTGSASGSGSDDGWGGTSNAEATPAATPAATEGDEESKTDNSW